MNVRTALLAGLLLVSPDSQAQTPEPETADWQFSASLGFNLLDNGDTFLNPVVTADRDRLHLEARYNYENIDTGSVFAGANFTFGDEMQLTLTPVVGAVFGESEGVAPGLIWTLDWKKLSWYTASEYIFDTSERESSFLYAWSELDFKITDDFWLGAAVQRTRAYRAALDVQRGLTVGFSHGDLYLSAYAFNVFTDDPYAVLSIEVDF